MFAVVPAVQAQNTKILPADTELVMTFNLKQILTSEVFKANQVLVDLAKAKITEQLDDKGVAKWLKKADFDLFRDLNVVTFAVPGGRNPEEGFILLEGNFDSEKIEAAVMEASKEVDGGVKVITIAGTRAFEVTPKDEKTMYVGVLDKKTMIASVTKADFTEAVARNKGTRPATFKTDVVKNLMASTSKKQSLSFLATSKVLAKLGENNPNANNDQAKMAMAALQQVEGFSAALTIQKDIDFQLGINAKDADTAKKIEGVVGAGLLIARGKVMELAKQNEKLAPAVDVVNSIRAVSKGPNLTITGQITFDALEKLLQNLPMP
jgi:hypothetical protein